MAMTARWNLHVQKSSISSWLSVAAFALCFYGVLLDGTGVIQDAGPSVVCSRRALLILLYFKGRNTKYCIIINNIIMKPWSRFDPLQEESKWRGVGEVQKNREPYILLFLRLWVVKTSDQSVKSAQRLMASRILPLAVAEAGTSMSGSRRHGEEKFEGHTSFPSGRDFSRAPATFLSRHSFSFCAPALGLKRDALIVT